MYYHKTTKIRKVLKATWPKSYCLDTKDCDVT